MRYQFFFRHCATCDRETLHVALPKRRLRRTLGRVLTLGLWRPAIPASAACGRCACCGAIPNPDHRHPLRLRLDAASG